MTKVAVVAHADKLAGRDRKRLKQALGDAGIDAPWFAVSKAKQAGSATRKALKGGASTVIVCGGDGTVRAASEALVGTDATLAVLPVGHGEPVRHRLRTAVGSRRHRRPRGHRPAPRDRQPRVATSRRST